MIKILLVEDDPDVLDLVGYLLRRERYVVLEAQDGTQAIRRWRAEHPDLVVLDLGIPGLDGFEVLRQIRDEDDTPVLVLSARKEAHDILRAFDLGSDDFVPKPFEYRELIARARAILRRRAQVAHVAQADAAEPSIHLDGLTVDPVAYEFRWRNQSVRLTPTELRILYLLVANAGHTVPASRLYAYVWGSEGAVANALRSHMSHLRRKLESGGRSPGTISSIPAVGYVFRRAPQPMAATPAPMNVAPSEAGSAA